MEGMSHGLEWWISGDNHLNGEDVTSVKEKETIEGEGLSTSRLTLVPFFFLLLYPPWPYLSLSFLFSLLLIIGLLYIHFSGHIEEKNRVCKNTREKR